MSRVPDEPRTEADELAFAAAREICRRHARSFYFASFFLPKPKRDASYAVYAFCRLIDDAIDVGENEKSAPNPTTVGVACCSTSELDTRLALFRDKLEVIYANKLPGPGAASDSNLAALYAFQKTVHRYEIPKQYFLELAEGCRM